MLLTSFFAKALEVCLAFIRKVFLTRKDTFFFGKSKNYGGQIKVCQFKMILYNEKNHKRLRERTP